MMSRVFSKLHRVWKSLRRPRGPKTFGDLFKNLDPALEPEGLMATAVDDGERAEHWLVLLRRIEGGFHYKTIEIYSDEAEKAANAMFAEGWQLAYQWKVEPPDMIELAKVLDRHASILATYPDDIDRMFEPKKDFEGEQRT